MIRLHFHFHRSPSHANWMIEIWEVVLIFESVDEILWCAMHHSNDSALTELSRGTIHSVCGSTFESKPGWNPMVLPFKWNFFRSTFTWYYLFTCSSNFWVCEWNPMVWPFKWSLFSSSFAWHHLLDIKLQNRIRNFCWILTLANPGRS